MVGVTVAAVLCVLLGFLFLSLGSFPLGLLCALGFGVCLIQAQVIDERNKGN